MLSLPLALLLGGLALPPSTERLSVLIVDGQNNHAWAQTTPVLEAVLENSGRFTVDVATSPDRGQDVAGFRPDFSAYDVVVSNYNGEQWDEATCQDFEAYVEGGGGFVSVHAADNAFPGWSAYNAMIGVGGWGGRNEGFGPYLRLREGSWIHDTSPGRGGSHGKRHEFVVEARSEHPILAGLPTRWKHNVDELYDRLRGPARDVTVLASAFANPELGGSGEHEPMLMTIEHGDGRVFHTTLGHDVRAMHGVGFQATLCRGTEWAATGVVTLPVPEDFPGPETSSSHDPLAYLALFDGRSLDGWVQRNGSASYRVEEGAIVGTTTQGSPNSFLCSEQDFGNFELLFEVKVHAALNSGVQIRSKSLPEVKDGRVHGPQVEIEAGPGEAGHIYSEATGRGWLSPESERTRTEKREAFQNDAWNHYRVRAEGARIRTWVNGRAIADLEDPESSRSGFIGLQVHSIPKDQGPYEVRWRALRLRKLP